MRWFVTLLLGAAGGYLAARLATRTELDEFQRDLADRDRRSAAPTPSPTAPLRASEMAVPQPPPPEAPGIDPAKVMLIAATVAAYLGKHAVVRRIKVAGHRTGDPWAVYGRATLQASHDLVQVHR